MKLLKSIAKDLPENQHFRTELNKPVFKCVLGFARNIDKHSVQQVRQLMFNLLENLTLKKQELSAQKAKQRTQAQ